jgi:CBS domain-containing protein
MRAWQVSDVMSTDVATVGAGTPYRDLVDLITSKHISAVPVVDGFGLVLGVVSEADLMHKVELVGEPHERRIIESRRRRNARVKADALTAADLMTAPAVVTYPDTTVVAAAKTMEREQVKRLPVINTLGRLIGIVTRSDLLRVHLRPDADIRSDIVDEVLRRVLGVDDDVVSVEVDDGVVRLTGQLDTRSAMELAARLAANVSGVVALVNELSFARDDSLLAKLSGPGHPLGGN